MDWAKSKTIIIWLLVALNIYLFFVNTILKTSYDFKGEQEKGIIELLNKNGIGIYDEIDIKYKPLAPINILASEDDIDEKSYLDLFFTNPHIVREDNQSIVTENSKEIIFENGFMSFNINNEEDYISYEGDLETFIINIEPAYKNFVLDKTFKQEDGFIYEFREKYKDKIIYTNYLSVKVVDNKIAGMQGFYGKVIKSNNKPREIASMDMVLCTFMEEAKVIYEDKTQVTYEDETKVVYEDKNIFITAVDLVYYQEEYSSYDVVKNTTKAIPCYRIYSEGEQTPFIISAYENKVIN